MTGYEAAKAKYEALGVDTDRAIERLKKGSGIAALLAAGRCDRI